MESWLAGHWFDLAQTAGIIAVGLFNLADYREAKNARRITNLTELIRSHREIWREYAENPKLWRIKQSKVDLEKVPITIEEETFVKLVIAHLFGAFHAAQLQEIVALDTLPVDVAAFVSLPIPRAVWERLKPVQTPRFANFIDNALTSFHQ